MSPAWASGMRGASGGNTVSAEASRKVGVVRVLSVDSCREHLGGWWPARPMTGRAMPAVGSLWQHDVR